MGGARGAHLLATAQLDELEGRQMRETRRHAAAAVLQAYHRGGEARAARRRWELLTGETSIVELKRQAREHEAHMRQIGQASHAARRLGAAGRGLLARSRTRGARLRAAQASSNIRRSLAVSGAPLLGSRCRDGRLPGLAHLTLLPRDSGGGGGGALAISVQSVERAGHNRQLPGSPHSRSPLAPLRSIAAGASSPPPPQQQRQQQVGTGMPLPPLVTSGSDPAAPAAQLSSDPASLGGATTTATATTAAATAAAAAAAAAGSALDDAAALPAAASPGAKISSQEIERARRSSPPLPAADTAALHARWLRRRMELEEAEATARVAEAVAAAAAATARYREAIAERHAARRGAARRTKLPLPLAAPHRAESFDWASLEWLEAPAPLVRRLPQLYGATGQKYAATGPTLRGSASAPKLQQHQQTWRTPDGP